MIENKFIYKYEDLEYIIERPYRCYRVNYFKDANENTIALEAIIYIEESHTYYSVQMQYSCCANNGLDYNNYHGHYRDRDYWFSEMLNMFVFYNRDIYNDYIRKFLDMQYKLSENYTNVINAYANLYNVDPKAVIKYFKDIEDLNYTPIDEPLLKSINYAIAKPKTKHLKPNGDSIYEHSLGKYTIDNSVKISFSSTPENKHNKKVFDFIQVELPIYRLDMRRKENINLVKDYVVERIEKDKQFKKYGVPVNILKCYSISRSMEYFTFRFEIKDIKESK